MCLCGRDYRERQIALMQHALLLRARPADPLTAATALVVRAVVESGVAALQSQLYRIPAGLRLGAIKGLIARARAEDSEGIELRKRFRQARVDVDEWADYVFTGATS